MSLAVVLTGCARSHDEGTPAAKSAAPVVPTTTAVPEKSVVKVTAAKPAHDYLHFAKDGKCADKLANAYLIEARTRHSAQKVLAQNIRAFNLAKKDQSPNLELWSGPIRAGVERLREHAKPFQDLYGTFACPHRATGEILSSEKLDADLLSLEAFVEKELGLDTESKPNTNNTKLEE